MATGACGFVGVGARGVLVGAGECGLAWGLGAGVGAFGFRLHCLRVCRTEAARPAKSRQWCAPYTLRGGGLSHKLAVAGWL